jgi:hypothetical protein
MRKSSLEINQVEEKTRKSHPPLTNLIAGNSIEGPQPAVFMPEKLASGISAGKVKFLLMAFSAVAVRWIWA